MVLLIRDIYSRTLELRCGQQNVKNVQKREQKLQSHTHTHCVDATAKQSNGIIITINKSEQHREK